MSHTKPNRMTIRLWLYSLVLALLVWSRPGFADEQKSLYDRLGGIHPIAAVVDDFVDRLLADKKIGANAAVRKAMAKATKAGLKYRVTAFVAQAAGGPEVYKGRTMQESHATMNISEPEWAAMLNDFRKTMKKFKIPPVERDELITLLGTTKDDIVTH